MELGERRRRILAAVVHDYVQTAEPVGSETLVERHEFGVKSATIRNELAAMADMGYLRQPHTSAGRVPSDLGYRYYVDRLMPDPSLEASDTSFVRRNCDRQIESEVERILHSTCHILSSLTSYASVATPPQLESISIKHVAVSVVSAGKLLVITVLNTGHISHRVVDHPGELQPAELIALGNLINEAFDGVDLKCFGSADRRELPGDMLRVKHVYRKIVGSLKQILVNAADDEVFVDGAGNILKHPEFIESGRAAHILEVLEKRRILFQIMSSSLLGEEVTVIIGSENQFGEMHECSFVASSYSVGNRVCGSIGVIGPTRMDYRRAVAAVEFMSSNLSDLLTWLSVG